jgi:hypothetical protein
MVSTGDATMVVSVYRTTITGKTELLSFTIEPPDAALGYKCETAITICVAHQPGPSKRPFSQLATVMAALIEDVERIANTMEATVGPMQTPVSVDLSQASHFKSSKMG